jgi:hypothetical protein
MKAKSGVLISRQISISITSFFSKRGECKEARRRARALVQRHASTTRTCEERDHDDDGVPPHDVE